MGARNMDAFSLRDRIVDEYKTFAIIEAVWAGEIVFNLIRTSPLDIVKRHTLGLDDDQWPQQEHESQEGSRLSRQRN